MRRLTVALVATLALACPPPAMADKKKDAVVAGAIIGALIAGAAAAAKNRDDSNRYNYATDKVFYPADMPGVICYTRARMCYVRGHYSTWATREVF